MTAPRQTTISVDTLAEQLHYHCGTLAGTILKLELLQLTEQLSSEGINELNGIIAALRQMCGELRLTRNTSETGNQQG